MEIKMRERKISYTIMIASDSSRHPVKRFHLKGWLLTLLLVLLFLLVVVSICYMVYSTMTLVDATNRSARQAEEISRMAEDYETLENTNAELEGKVVLLSETVNQKVAAEQNAEKIEEEAHLPSGFPLSGSAQIQETEAKENNEVVFEAAVGIHVTAAGDGTVEGVDTDPEYGNVIHINHGNGYVTSYRNSGSPIVKLGDQVLAGTALYLIGEDNTTVVYQMKHNDAYIDPMEMIEING